MDPVIDEEQALPEGEALAEILSKVRLRVDHGDHDAEVLREDLGLNGAAPGVALAYPFAKISW